jgi:hypothetical protein
MSFSQSDSLPIRIKHHERAVAAASVAARNTSVRQPSQPVGTISNTRSTITTTLKKPFTVIRGSVFQTILKTRDELECTRICELPG